MKKVILLLFILLAFLFSGCTQCVPKIVIKKEYIKTKKSTFIKLDEIEDCIMHKGIHYDDLNDTRFWITKTKLAECSNVSMKRKDKNVFYELKGVK